MMCSGEEVIGCDGCSTDDEVVLHLKLIDEKFTQNDTVSYDMMKMMEKYIFTRSTKKSLLGCLKCASEAQPHLYSYLRSDSRFSFPPAKWCRVFGSGLHPLAIGF